MLEHVNWTSPAAAAIALGLLWLAEGVAPMFAAHGSRGRRRLRNLALGLVNALAASTAFAALTYWGVEYARAADWGLLRLVELHWALEWAIAFALIDAAHYLFHVAAHHLPLLWRLHLVHHHDDHVDVTSAMRFHTLEVGVMCALMLAAYAFVGVSMGQVLLYEAVLLPVAMFHHANIQLSEPFDRLLRLIIVTPRMHWVHHSQWRPETDSNFSSVLSIWDRLFGTYRVLRDPRGIAFGLEGYEDASSRTLGRMLAAPFEASKSGEGAPLAEHSSRRPAPLWRLAVSRIVRVFQPRARSGRRRAARRARASNRDRHSAHAAAMERGARLPRSRSGSRARRLHCASRADSST